MPNPIQLTPEEIAEYEQKAAATAGPAPINPVRDLSAEELVDLSVKDSSFSIPQEFNKNKDLWGDSGFVQKVADAHDMLLNRGFSTESLPGGKGVISTTAGLIGHGIKAGAEMGKGFAKQAWNYVKMPGEAVAGMAGFIAGEGPEFQVELIKQAERGHAEALAGTEAGMMNLAGLGETAADKAARLARRAAAKPYTPEEKVKNLFAASGKVETQEDIMRGHGAFSTAVRTEEVIKEAEKEGLEVRPEETAVLAAGDPFSLYAMGKGFSLTGKAVGAAIPGVVKRGAATLTEKAGTQLEKMVGGTLQGAGVAGEAVGKAAASPVAKAIGPAIVLGEAVATGSIPSLEHMLSGGFAGVALEHFGKASTKLGGGLAKFGAQVRGTLPVSSSLAQITKDVLHATPAAMGDVAHGIAFDIGLAAASAQTPQETEVVGVGAAFGLAKGTLRVGARTLSGLIIAPRAYGIDKPSPSSGAFPGLDRMHNDAFAALTPGQRARINAVRWFTRGATPDTDVFAGKDTESISRALQEAGLDKARADELASQEGFFSVGLPGKDGKPHRIVLVKNVDAAPHESFHAFQDVLGEEANQVIDKIVKEQYGPQWEYEGYRYARRLVGGPLGDTDWREVILDFSGWGQNAAKERIARDISNRIRSQTGAEPSLADVEAMTKAEYGRIMDEALARNSDLSPEQMQRMVWRDVFKDAPEEAMAIADKYIAREIAAENFDMVFKHGLDTKGLTHTLAQKVANLVYVLGFNPMAGRVSQIGRVEPKFGVVEAVKGAVEGRAPEKPAIEIPPTAAAPAAPQQGAQKAKDWIEKNPTGNVDRDQAVVGLADALADGSGIRVLYWGAKGDPAGEVTSVRPERRAEIEAQREVANKNRQLMEKEIFPYRVDVRKNGPQFVGWSPDNFEANVGKLTEWLGQLQRKGVDVSEFPYEVDPQLGRLTAKGREDLMADAQQFVSNQLAGLTGAGRELTVPPEVTARGYTQPEKTGLGAVMDQNRADIINYLFNIQLPETVTRVAPLHLAGQEISAATEPGRLVEPVRPRGEYKPEQLEKAGIPGPRRVLEVNPFRQWVEQTAKSAGVARPSLVEVSQRLNIGRIEKVAPSTRPEKFGGNVLTLAAGLQPRELATAQFAPSQDPRAIKSAAVRDRVNGKIYEGTWHGEAMMKAVMDTARVSEEEALSKLYTTYPDRFEDGFTTNTENEFLDREQAYTRAEELKQIRAADYQKESGGYFDNRLESDAFAASRQFQPPAEEARRVAEMTPDEFVNWTKTLPRGFTRAAIQAGIAAPDMEFVNFLKTTHAKVSAETKRLLAAKDYTRAMSSAMRAQYFREAYEAATGTGSVGDTEPTFSPDYKPPFPQPEAQAEQKAAAPKEADYNTIADTEAQFAPREMSENEAPAKTKKAYKIFRTLPSKPGKIFPLFIGAKNETPLGVWLEAENLPKKPGFALRPGWHSGELPMSPQLLKKNGTMEPTRVWAEVEIPADVDWQAEADKTPSKDIKGEIPKEGYYKFREKNGVTWNISGAIKVNRLLSNAEIRDILTKAGRGKEADIYAKTTQAEPIEGSEDKFPPSVRGSNFKRAWIFPNGKVVQLGGMWHSDWLDRNRELVAEFGVTDIPKFGGYDTEGARQAALKAGFARVNYDAGSGILTVEARAADWNKVRDAYQRLAETNLDDIDTAQVFLMDRDVKSIVDSEKVQLFRIRDNADKLAAFPFMSEEARTTGGPVIAPAPETAAIIPGQEEAARAKRMENIAKGIPTEAQAMPNFETPEFKDEIEKIRSGELFGQTFNVDGSVWVQPEKPSDIVTLASKNIPKEELTPEAVTEALKPYEALFGKPGITAGIFSFEQDGKPMVSIDLNTVVPQEHRANTLKFAKANNQLSIWDAAKGETVETGGTGETVLTSPEQISPIIEKLQKGEAVTVPSPRSSVKYFTGPVPEIKGTGVKGKVGLWDTVKYLSEENAKRGKLAEHTDENATKLATAIAEEAKFAYDRDKSALGWYEAKLSKMKQILLEFHPELADENKFMVYKALLAINSNGQDIYQNLFRTDTIYEGWKNTGRFDFNSTWGGKNSRSINLGIKNLSEMIAARGLDKTREFLATDFVVGDLKRAGYDIPGELVSGTVKGSVILGPKIGSFYGNLNGDYSSVTMDRWFMRTFHRLDGTLTDVLQARLAKQIRAVLDAFKGKRVDNGHELAPIREEFRRILDSLEDGTFDQAAIQDKDSAMYHFLADRYHPYSSSGFKERTPQNTTTKNLYENLYTIKLNEAPHSGSERQWIRTVMDEAQRQLKSQGIDLTNADLQALLWYYEKELHSKFYKQVERAKPTDYAIAAERFVAKKRGNARPEQSGRPTGAVGEPRSLVEPRTTESASPGGGEVTIEPR